MFVVSTLSHLIFKTFEKVMLEINGVSSNTLQHLTYLRTILITFWKVHLMLGTKKIRFQPTRFSFLLFPVSVKMIYLLAYTYIGMQVLRYALFYIFGSWLILNRQHIMTFTMLHYWKSDMFACISVGYWNPIRMRSLTVLLLFSLFTFKNSLNNSLNLKAYHVFIFDVCFIFLLFFGINAKNIDSAWTCLRGYEILNRTDTNSNYASK